MQREISISSKLYLYYTGVYRLDENLMVFIDVSSVPELHLQSVSNEITLGGNVSLTQTIDIMNNVATKPGFEYCRYIAEHIDRVANVPVRNVGIVKLSYFVIDIIKIRFQSGTLAGNLSIKHAHNEFASDIFTILEGCGAKLTILDCNNLRTVASPMEYLSLDMNKKCILKIVFPRLGTGYRFRSYKVFLQIKSKI